MGSYAECWLSDLLVTSTKNDVDPGLMRLFRQSDKRIVPLSSADAPVQLKRRFEGVNDDIDLDDFAEEPELVYYIAPVSMVKDRLTSSATRWRRRARRLCEGLNGERVQTDRWLRAREDAEPQRLETLCCAIYRAEQKILSELSPDVWQMTVKEILTGASTFRVTTLRTLCGWRRCRDGSGTRAP